jgi:hypothetical protein
MFQQAPGLGMADAEAVADLAQRQALFPQVVCPERK